MTDIERLESTVENIKECERIRYDSVGYKIEEKDLLTTECAKRLARHEIIAFGSYLENALAAACYVSSDFGSIIDHL